MNVRKVGGLLAVLGHDFREPSFLDQALTHPSASSPARPDNQRMEFLGDRVLGLVIAEALLETFPSAPEGDLAPRFNALVRRETLAEIAGEIGLGQHLRLGRSESISGGRTKAAILADAMEAVIAAIYLDGGFEAARAFVRQRWGERIASIRSAPVDPKTQLQEWAQARGMRPPNYELLERRGPDHAPEFLMRVTLENGREAEARAASKKAAEQLAAKALYAGVANDG